MATFSPISAKAEEIDGALHVSAGADKNVSSTNTLSAGFHVDPAVFFFDQIRSQTFELGLAYDRVQRASGGTADFRVRVPILRCYGWEFHCENKRFWISAVPSIGKRWGGGGLGGYAAIQAQAIFYLSQHSACCRLALGVEHRFPINSVLRNDNRVVFELRTAIAFIDRAPPRAKS